MKVRTAVILAALMSSAACSAVRVGSDFDPRAFESKVERGQTTQAQVRGWLGAPSGIGVSVDTSGERFEEWTYYYARGRLPDMPDLEVKVLQVKFDRHGIVRGYSWSAQ
jgi:outer membrane protein assembly factor BamE (lipoprotein component of BamABCDE complex)